MRIKQAISSEKPEESEILDDSTSRLCEWTEALTQAEEVFDRIASKEERCLAVFNLEFKRGMERIIAENICLDKGIIPPHWRHIVNCKKCGPMPIGEVIPGEVVACPWCSTPYGGTAEMRNCQSYRDFEKIQHSWRKHAASVPARQRRQ